MLTKEEARNLLVLLARLTTIQFNEVEAVAALKAKLGEIVNAPVMPTIQPVA